MASNTMNLDLIQEMVDNYKSKQYLSIVTNKVNPMPFDAQSVRFDLNALKLFIETIESEVAKHPEYKLENLGIRFYYSAYPTEESWEKNEGLNGVPGEYAKLHTLIAIPTAEINKKQSDFDPLDVKTYDGTKPSGERLAIMAENHGFLVPPDHYSNLWF
jgi:hypothetical protein